MNSIFRRLLLTYLIIAAGIILLISVLLSQALERHLLAEKQDFLLSTARYVNTLLIRTTQGSLTRNELSRAVNIVGETANARVVILDFSNVSKVDREVIAATLNSDDQELIVNVERILSGETILRSRQYAGELGVHVVAVGIPARSGVNITGAIILFSPVYQTDLALGRFRQVTLITALVTFLFAVPVVYYISRRISRPIILVSESADALATGQPIEDIPPSGKDELGRLVRSFNEMKNKIKQMEVMRTNLLASVSHELRTPLTAICGFIQALRDGVVPKEDQDRVLHLALQESRQLSKLVNDLLDIARLESGAMVLHKKKINLYCLLEEVTHLLADRAKERNISIDLKTDTVCEVYADEDRIRQVLLNLLVNAIQYNRPGGHVKATLTLQSNRAVILTVEDNGPGIPARHLPFVFEKFYRVEPARGADGTGLGLAVSKQIVEQHGGQIRMESEEGYGTSVIVELPTYQC